MTMFKPMITTNNQYTQKEMSDFEARGIISYLNDLFMDMYDEDEWQPDAEKLFGTVRINNYLECTEVPSAEWLLPNESDAIKNEYLVQRFWLTTNGVLLADIQHAENESLEMVVRIN